MREIPMMHPRRRPRQARAQATVDAIIQATGRVRVEDGYDRASTNRIAQAAGVSIGSLYQYFPSKEALVAALVEEHVNRMVATVTHLLESVTSARLPEHARALVVALIAAYRVDPKLHQVLCQEVPKIGELKRIYDFEQQLGGQVRQYLGSLHQQIRHQHVDRAVFLLMNAVPSVIRAAVESDPEGTNDDTLTTELTDMILRYLVYVPSSESGAYEIPRMTA